MSEGIQYYDIIIIINNVSMIVCTLHLISGIQFRAKPNDFYANRVSAIELALRLRLNLTYGFDKAAWPTEPSFVGFPTLANAVYNRQANQICKLLHSNNKL